MINTALEQLDKINELEARTTELRADLKRSLLLAQLWPGVFMHGKATTQVTGNPRRALTFVIKDGSDAMRYFDDAREFDLIDVPVELWPAAVIADIDAVHQFDTKYAMPLYRYRRDNHKGQL